jgi:ubiquinone/menaquinone biosynthesis C-methylase UbiE
LDKAIGVDLKPIADLVASIDDLPMVDDGSVDVIISRHSLEHILDSVKTLKEWRRILKSGGIIILVLPDHGSIDTMDMILSGGVHLHAFTMDSLKNLLSFFPELIITKIEPVIDGWSFGAIIKKQ